SLDLFHALLGRAGRRTGAVNGASEVIDHDLGPPGGQQEGVLPPEAATGPGDDRHPALEADVRHAILLALYLPSTRIRAGDARVTKRRFTRKGEDAPFCSATTVEVRERSAAGQRDPPPGGDPRRR